jgi:D-serine deaminase-like pyridoxal phosphate-dependent protein
MAASCRNAHIGLRPHTKTHKTLEFARMQMERGAVGLTVAKVGEAEVMAEAVPLQILVAHPIFGREKLSRLARIGRDLDVLIAIDDEITADAISRVAVDFDCTLGILVEFDSGFRRCGLPPGAACVELARTIEKLPNVKMRGLMTYFGSVWGPEEERKREVNKIAASVEMAIEAFQKIGMPLEIVSGGSTPAADFSQVIPGLTEIRPGTYIFNDMNTYYQGVCGLEDCAARVITTVVSTAIPGQAVIDAGSKTLSQDALGSGPMTGFGRIVEAPEASLFKLNEEHGYLRTSPSQNLKIGDVLSVIPNHVCSCVNLHDEIFLARGEQVIDSWKVAARGKTG